MIEPFVHEVHRRAALAGTGGEHRFVHAVSVHARAAEGGEQRRVHVHDPAGVRPDHVGGHEAKVPGEHDVVHLRVAQGGEQRRAFRVRSAGEQGGGDAAGAGPLQRTGGRPVRRHEHHVGGAALAERVQVVEDRLQIGAAARGEHGQACLHEPAPSSTVTASSSVAATAARSRAMARSSAGVSSFGTRMPVPPRVRPGSTSRNRSPT